MSRKIFTFIACVSLGISLFALISIESDLKEVRARATFISSISKEISHTPTPHPMKTYEFTTVEDGEVSVWRKSFYYCSAKAAENFLWISCFDSHEIFQSHVFRALEFKEVK